MCVCVCVCVYHPSPTTLSCVCCSFSVASGPSSGYNLTVSSDSQHEALNGVMQNTPDGLMMQAIMRKNITDYLSVQNHALVRTLTSLAVVLCVSVVFL